jgi:hypothetical protein
VHFVGWGVVSTLEALINLNISLATVTLNTGRQGLMEQTEVDAIYKCMCVWKKRSVVLLLIRTVF